MQLTLSNTSVDLVPMLCSRFSRSLCLGRGDLLCVTMRYAVDGMDMFSFFDSYFTLYPIATSRGDPLHHDEVCCVLAVMTCKVTVGRAVDGIEAPVSRPSLESIAELFFFFWQRLTSFIPSIFLLFPFLQRWLYGYSSRASSTTGWALLSGWTCLDSMDGIRPTRSFNLQ